jgi:hypothetical protein
LALFDPLRSRERLTLRTMPIAATVVGDASMLAVVARLDVAAERSGATCGDRPHDAPLRIRQRSLVLSTIGGPVAVENVRHFELDSLHVERGSEVLWRLGRFRRRQGLRQQVQGAAGRADLGDG